MRSSTRGESTGKIPASVLLTLLSWTYDELHSVGFLGGQTLLDLCRASSADLRSQAPAYQGFP